MNNSKNFLIFGHNYIGDVLMLTPAIRALKLRFPESRITVVASREASYVLKRNSDVWKIVETENIRGIKGIIGIFKLFGTLKKINKINEHKFYACINFLTSFKFSVLGFLLAETQLGQEKFLNNFFLRDKIRADKSLHNIDKSLKFIEPFYNAADAAPAFGEKYFSRNCVYDAEGEDIENAKNILKNFFNGYGNGYRTAANGENFKFVLFSPCSTRKSKEANPETFSLFADYLNKKGFYVAITGSKKDILTSKKIYEKIKNKRMSADLTGLTDIYTLGGLIKKSNLVVSVDNGTMHLASAIKTPLIALFGSTDPAVCGPLPDNACIIDKKKECYHCFDKNCSKDGFNMHGYPDCMGHILPEDLIQCSEALL